MVVFYVLGGLVIVGVGVTLLALMSRPRDSELSVSATWLDEHIRGRRP